jgi:hypothetical protein
MCKPFPRFWYSFPGLYIFECLLFVKKHLELFEINSNVHSHNTRSSNKLRVIQHQKAFLETSPKYRLIHLYNILPNSISSIDNFKLFKKALFNHLFKMNLYCINDYFI